MCRHAHIRSYRHRENAACLPARVSRGPSAAVATGNILNFPAIASPTSPNDAAYSVPPTAPKDAAIKLPTAPKDAAIELPTAPTKADARAPRNAPNAFVSPIRKHSYVRAIMGNEYAVAIPPYVRGIPARGRADSHMRQVVTVALASQ